MGKRKRNKTDDMQFGMNYSSSMYKDDRKLLDRYGVRGQVIKKLDNRYGDNAYRGADDVRKDLQKAMSQDYDTRRTLEAASLNGNKKAKKLLNSGFKSFQNMADTQDFFEKKAKKMGQGGAFDSPSDYMGLTQKMVEKERRGQTESIDASINSKVEGLRNEFMQKLQDQQSQIEQQSEPEVQTSDRLANARSQVSQVEGTNFDQQPAAPDQADQTGSVAQQMLSDYKKRIADQMKPVNRDGL